MIKNAKIVSIGGDPDEYHAQVADRGSKDYIMSASALKIFATCPRRWKKGYELPESDAKHFGSLLDTMLLTPKQFSDRFVIKPTSYKNDKGEVKPWNGNANACKEWLADHEGMDVVSNTEYGGALAAIERLREDEVIATYLDDSDKQVHVSAEWHDPETGITVPIKGLLDLVPRPASEFSGTLGDLKTTKNAGLLSWQRWAFQAGYHLQGALYQDLYVAATGEDRNTFCFLIVENFSPWETAKRMLSQEFYTLGKAEYTRLMGNYCMCLKHDKWPSYDDTDEAIQGWGMCHAEPFQAERAAFAPRYNFDETEPETETDPNEVLQ